MLELSRHDPVAQRVDSQLVHVSSRGLQLYPVRLRYAWPSELDLMARLAHLTLLYRWANWQREAFGATSAFHVSLYGYGGALAAP